MQKIIYIVLAFITIGLIGYTGYYIMEHREVPFTEIIPPVSPIATTVVVDKNMLTTSTGKNIRVLETNPNGESLSTITLIPTGFSTNTLLTLEKSKLIDFFLVDINKDHFDELVLVTEAMGSGSYGEAVIFTTASDTSLTPVTIPEITEKDTQKGKLFEGYTGHDSFSLVEGELIREFPTYKKNDTNDNPTGPRKSIIYSLVEKNGLYSVIFLRGTSTPYVPPIVATTTTTSTTTKIEQVPSTGSTTPLTSSSWIWSTLQSKGVTTEAPQGGKFVLSLDTNNHINSTTDCNTLSGDYAFDTATIEFGALASTKKSCEGSRESEYAAYLVKAISYKIQGTDLIFTLLDKSTMTFKKK